MKLEHPKRLPTLEDLRIHIERVFQKPIPMSRRVKILGKIVTIGREDPTNFECNFTAISDGKECEVGEILIYLIDTPSVVFVWWRGRRVFTKSYPLRREG